MTMAGSLWAACIDSPADSIYGNAVIDETTGDTIFPVTHKRYFGSASSKSKSKRGEKKHIEGQEIIIPCNKKYYSDLVGEISEDMRSAVSYAGGTHLSALKEVKFIYRG
jgi:GMP reductase